MSYKKYIRKCFPTIKEKFVAVGGGADIKEGEWENSGLTLDTETAWAVCGLSVWENGSLDLSYLGVAEDEEETNEHAEIEDENHLERLVEEFVTKALNWRRPQEK